MRVLGLETSEYVSGLALWQDGAIVAQQTFASRMNLCETLAGRLSELLSHPPGPLPPALDGLAISLGPGSFTGLRVGLATAKALAHAWQLPLVGLCTQQVIAATAREPVGTQVCVVQNARQGHWYAGVWEITATGPIPRSALRVLSAAEFPAFVERGVDVVGGPAIESLLEAAVPLPDGLRLCTVMPTAATVAALGASLLVNADPAAAAHLQPIYVLPSQAERQKQLVVTAESPAMLPRPPLVLRPGTLEDLSEVVRLENASFSSPWPERSLREELTRGPGGLFLVAELEGRLAGYICAWIYAGEAHICNVAVDPERRRSGLGELLLLTLIDQACQAHCDMVILEYRLTNTPAAGLYEKLGFRVIGTRRGYYQDTGEDALVASLADVATAERRQALAELRRQWDTRYDYDLHVTL